MKHIYVDGCSMLGANLQHIVNYNCQLTGETIHRITNMYGVSEAKKGNFSRDYTKPIV